MRDEVFWSLLVLVWVFGWAGIWFARKRAREAQALKLREMLHQERLTAIKAGTPLPEIPSLDDSSEWLDPEMDRIRASWLRRLSLILGLAGVTAGAGICAAFYWSPDRGMFAMWTIGLIPILAGFGFLLYCLISPVFDPGRGAGSVDR